MKVMTRIQREVERFDRAKIMRERQIWLQELVNDYGIEFVAEASGLKQSTIKQNLNSRSPLLGYDALNQADTILKIVLG